MRYLIFILLLFASVLQLRAQQEDVTARIKFISDSVQIGNPLFVSLIADHPSTIEIIFPDTNTSFGKFTFRRKDWFPTVTANMMSKDSAVYELITFTPQTFFTLSLPIYVLNDGDSSIVNSNLDTIYFNSSLKAPLKGLQEETTYQYVKELLDYPRGILILVLTLITAGIGYGIFGKRITLAIRQILLFRRQRIFLSIFDRLLEQALREVNPARVEEILLLWKRHLQRLSGVNYSTYTTSDFAKYIKDDSLIAILRRIDKVVYARDTGEITRDLFVPLRFQAQKFYTERREALRNGA